LRVNDLSKEIGKQNKDLISFLAEKGIIKSAMSSISDEEVSLIRKNLSSGAPHRNPVQTDAEVRRESAEADASGQNVSQNQPKKKKFTAVFRPQNAQQIRGFRQSPLKQAPVGGRTFNVVKPEETHTDTIQGKPEVSKDELSAKKTPDVMKEQGGHPAENNKPAETPKAPEHVEKVQNAVNPEHTGDTKQHSETDTARGNNGTENGTHPAETSVPRAEGTPAPRAEGASSERTGAASSERTGAASSERTGAASQNRTGSGSYQNRTGSGNYQNRTGSGNYQNRTGGGNYQNRTGSGSYPNRTGSGSYPNRTGSGNYPNRTGSGNYQNRTGGTYQGRPGGTGAPSADRTGGTYQGRPGGTYQGRPGGTYQGRPGGTYQGRPGGTYQGRPGGTYQGRPGGTYQGRPGGTYQGRPGGTYQGRPGGTYQGRPGGGFAGRPGTGASNGKTTDGPLVKKTSRSRPSKNNFKDRNQKRLRTEDGVRMRTGKVSRHPFIMPEKPREEKIEEDIKEIIIPDTITIKDLAKKIKLNSSDIIGKLFKKGEMYTINSELSFEQVEELALEYDIIAVKEKKVDVIAELLKEEEDDPSTLVSRPPVVCVMGHVDHGKTSLLDAIRKTNVTSHEAGGITQHIGAYMVKINGREITFLDTPGHEAFTAMRMRGAQATDIAVLVVAADDGVMPQTIEAINHAKAAGVEIIVAINKVDKPNANVDRVKQELTEYELIPEEWGGQTTFCCVSAKTGEGIQNLLEMILLTADVKELKANPDRNARGLVIEAELDKGRGPVATVLIQKGTLKVGDFAACGACFGKIRAMLNEKGARVKEAFPSTPVQILGLDNVPNAGEIFVAKDNEREAKEFAATFITEGKNKLIADTKAKLSLDNLMDQIKAGNVKELPVIVKADVQGSVEAVNQSLTKIANDEVQVKVIHSGVGAINESDVDLAAASNAIIIGFNVRPDATAKSTADHEKVDIRLYKVIYQAIDDVEAAMKGMLAPVYQELVTGHAEIRQIFKASGVGNIAGSYVLDGKLQRGCKARIKRGEEQIFEGSVASIKRFKDDVKEVAAGYECGLVFDGFNDIAELDTVEAYIMVEVPRK